MSTAQSFVETMKKLIAREVAPLLPSWRWGQVTALGPVVIELDAEQGTLSEIGSLVSGLAIGDRVQVLTWGTRSTITGIAGGGGFQKRVFPTLAAAEAANLPVGVTVFVASENVDYVRASSGLVAIKDAARDGVMGVPITNTTDFESYPSAAAPTVVRDGNWVQFSATYRAKTANVFPTAENQLIIGRIPDGYRPRDKTEVVCQGSGTERWLFVVYGTGYFYGSRYSGSQGVGAWLPVQAVWLAQ